MEGIKLYNSTVIYTYDKRIDCYLNFFRIKKKRKKKKTGKFMLTLFILKLREYLI